MRIAELEDRLKGHAKITKSIISAPFDLKTEINKVEEKNMIKPKNITWLKRASTIAAVAAICAITIVSANSTKGFFKDVIRWDGAVIGTEYINATNDVKITTSDIQDRNITLALNITFENPNEAPFEFIQEVAIAEYKILDMNNKEILTVNSTIENSIKGKVKNGNVLVDLPIKEVDLNTDDKYLLIIDHIYGLSKADQPLKITGSWKCEFN